MKFIKQEDTEIKKFLTQFPRSKKIPIKIRSNTDGKIILIETEDKDVIKWIKTNLTNLNEFRN